MTRFSVRFSRFAVVGASLASGMVALSAAACTTQGVVQAATSSSSVTTPSVSAAEQSSSVPAPSASAPAPSSPSSSDPAPIHQTSDLVTAGGFALHVKSIELPYRPADPLSQAPAGKAWLAMDFSATDVSGQPLMFSSLGAFTLHDSQNREYDPSSVGADSLPDGREFPDHTMQPNETAHGEVVFEVDQDAKGLVLTFKGNVWQDDGAPAMVQLSP